jgi:hypothetical protein
MDREPSGNLPLTPITPMALDRGHPPVPDQNLDRGHCLSSLLGRSGAELIDIPRADRIFRPPLQEVEQPLRR